MKTTVKRKKAKTLPLENKKDAFAFAGSGFRHDLLFQVGSAEAEFPPLGCFSTAGVLSNRGVAFQLLGRFSAAATDSHFGLDVVKTKKDVF